MAYVCSPSGPEGDEINAGCWVLGGWGLPICGGSAGGGAVEASCRCVRGLVCRGRRERMAGSTTETRRTRTFRGGREVRWTGGEVVRWR